MPFPQNFMIDEYLKEYYPLIQQQAQPEFTGLYFILLFLAPYYILLEWFAF